jgi:hypothetical protein
MFGQLTQLTAFDPTPMNVTLESAPQVYAWVSIMEDLSGLEPAADDWFDRDDVPDTLKALLAEVGRVYVPALLANAEAINDQHDQVKTEIDGREWVQEPFPYQAKCLHWIRQQYAGLDSEDREWVDDLLAGTGCELLVSRR